MKTSLKQRIWSKQYRINHKAHVKKYEHERYLKNKRNAEIVAKLKTKGIIK